MSVKSVYNFVPAPKENEVFKPDWADQVNHDIPFSDGESGEIEIKITAETPIFIRNGHSKENEVNEFSNYVIADEKKYFIPATSLKGMFRNVLEIITNSRMIQTALISVKHPTTYGLRDMNNQEYTMDNPRVRSGWLVNKGDKWVIQSCTNHRIALADIEQQFGLVTNSLKASGVNKNNLCKSETKNKLLRFSEKGTLGKWVGVQYKFDDDGDFEGYVVLYGDIDNKKYDYIFSKPNGTSYSVESRLIELLDNIEENGENEDDSLWRFFRKENWQPGIPVFFMLNSDGNSIKHFGLTKLYRRNNSHYLNEIEPFKSYLNDDGREKPDFSEILFGSVRTEPLKGRVLISNAWSDNAVTEKQEERVLNSPNPSFYPAYLKQNGKKGNINIDEGYKTYHDSDAELRGFKRYPVHLGIKPNIESENENIASQFIPLNEGAIFTGKIRYFNLRPCEIGALVSAITFHGNSDSFFHSLGGVKPYGFGKVKIQIENLSKISIFMKDFEYTMNKHLNNDQFANQKNIKELLSIASKPNNEYVDRLLKYPAIEVKIAGKKHNEFNDYKKDKEFLEDYSERNGEYKIPSQLDDKFISNLNDKEREVQKENERSIQEQRIKEKEEFDKAIESKDIGKLKLIADDLKSNFSELAKDRIEEIRLEKIQIEEEERLRLKKEKALSGIPSEWYSLDSFKNISNRIPKWIKLQNKQEIPDEFKEDLLTVLSKIIKIEFSRNNTKRLWKGDLSNNGNWKKVNEWLGPEKAQSLYNELTK